MKEIIAAREQLRSSVTVYGKGLARCNSKQAFNTLKMLTEPRQTKRQS